MNGIHVMQIRKNKSGRLVSCVHKRYVIYETCDDEVSFYFRAPRQGSYFLKVLIKPVQDDLHLNTPYEEACIYKIICSEEAPDVKPFPSSSDNHGSMYGPGVGSLSYGLTATEKKGILVTSDGRAEVVFRQSQPVKLHAKLLSYEIGPDELEDALKTDKMEEDIAIKCDLSIYMPGEYALQIYAMEPDTDQQSYVFICQYLIAYGEESMESLYGRIYDENDSMSLTHYNYSSDMYNAFFSVYQTRQPESSTPAPINPPVPEPSCPICFEPSSQMMASTKCGHMCCEQCMDGVLQAEQKRCPICREHLSQQAIYAVFLP